MTTVTQSEKIIAIVMYPGLTALDLVGPLQVLHTLELFEPRFRTVIVAPDAGPMDTDVHVPMIASATFEDVHEPYVLLVPGGRMATIRAMSDPMIRDYVTGAAISAEIVSSVCTGALILASVGLLEDRRATTNWFYHQVLKSFGARYTAERWTHDGRFITSAGVSAGIDMALYLVSQLTDEDTAKRVERAMDYDPQPPFGPIDWHHVGILPRVLRGGIGAAAPLLTAKPKRLSRMTQKEQ